VVLRRRGHGERVVGFGAEGPQRGQVHGWPRCDAASLRKLGGPLVEPLAVLGRPNTRAVQVRPAEFLSHDALPVLADMSLD
jgi:hypothetical protein